MRCLLFLIYLRLLAFVSLRVIRGLLYSLPLAKSKKVFGKGIAHEGAPLLSVSANGKSGAISRLVHGGRRLFGRLPRSFRSIVGRYGLQFELLAKVLCQILQVIGELQLPALNRKLSQLVHRMLESLQSLRGMSVDCFLE